MRSGPILQFAQRRSLFRQGDRSASDVANASNAPRKVMLEMGGILASALGVALGVNLLLLVLHIA